MVEMVEIEAWWLHENTVLPTPKNKGQINIGMTFPKPGTNIGSRQALKTNSSLNGA